MERVPQPASQEEGVSLVGIRNENFKRFQIPRKPVPTRLPEVPQSKKLPESSSKYSEDAPDYITKPLNSLDQDNKTPVFPIRPYPSDDSQAVSDGNGLDHSNANKTASMVSSPPASVLSTSSIISSPALSVSTASTYTQKAYQEVRHFAGGLIHHPSQSAKHFSILRHSHGLVFNQGSTTSIAISIFTDVPIPADRTIWLQSKGWTG